MLRQNLRQANSGLGSTYRAGFTSLIIAAIASQAAAASAQESIQSIEARNLQQEALQNGANPDSRNLQWNFDKNKKGQDKKKENQEKKEKKDAEKEAEKDLPNCNKRYELDQGLFDREYTLSGNEVTLPMPPLAKSECGFKFSYTVDDPKCDLVTVFEETCVEGDDECVPDEAITQTQFKFYYDGDLLPLTEDDGSVLARRDCLFTVTASTFEDGDHETTGTFNLRIENPCKKEDLTVTTALVGNSDVIEYRLTDAEQEITIEQPLAVTTASGSDVCNAGIVYALTLNGDTPITEDSSPVKVTKNASDGVTLAIESELFDLIGYHTIQLRALFPGEENYPAPDANRRLLAEVPENPFGDDDFADQLVIDIISPCIDPDSVTATVITDGVTNAFSWDYAGTLSWTMSDVASYAVVPSGCTSEFTYSCAMTASPAGAGDICAAATFDSATGDLSFETNDNATYPPGEYKFDITGTVGSGSDSVEVTLTITDPCPFATLTLSEDFPNVTEYFLRDADLTIWWDAINSLTSDVLVDCGAATFEFKNSDDSALDSSIFDEERDIADENDEKLIILRQEDVATAKDYNLKLVAYYADASANTVSTDFIVRITDPCATATSATTIYQPVSYTIAQGALKYYFTPTTPTPSWCEVTYAIAIDSTPLSTELTLDQSNKAAPFIEIDIDTDNFSAAGSESTDYTITVTATVGSGATTDSADSTATLTVKNPCRDASIVQITPSAASASGYQYTLGAAQEDISVSAFTLNDAKFSVCGDIEYIGKFSGVDVTETKSDFDTCSTNCYPIYFDQDASKFGVYTMRPEDKSYAGLGRVIEVVGYFKDYKDVSTAPTASMTDLLEFVDPCPTATISATTQNDVTDAYSGSQVFTLTPFTVTPTGFCDVQYACVSVVDDMAYPIDALTCNSFTAAGKLFEPTFDASTEGGTLSLAIGASEHASQSIPFGTYTVKIQGQIIGGDGTVVTETFDLEFIDPCITESLTATSQTSPSNDAFTGNDIELVLTEFTLSQSFTCAVTYECSAVSDDRGADVLSCSDFTTVGIPYGEASGADGKLVISFDSTDYNDGTIFAGDYTVTIKATLTANPSTTQTADVTFTLDDPCDTANVVATTQTDTTPNAFTGENIVFTLTEFESEGGYECPLTYSCVDISSPIKCADFTVAGELFGGSGTTNTLTYAADLADFKGGLAAQDYTISIKATNSASSNDKIGTFVLSLIDPCNAAKLTAENQTPPADDPFVGKTFSLTPFSVDVDNSCTVSYSCVSVVLNSDSSVDANFSCSDISGFDGLDQTGGDLTFTTGSAMFNLGVSPDKYKVTIKGTVKTMDGGEIASSAATAYFFYTLTDPCQNISYDTRVTQTNPSDTSYDGFPTVFSLTEYPDFANGGYECQVIYSCVDVTPSGGPSCSDFTLAGAAFGLTGTSPSMTLDGLVADDYKGGIPAPGVYSVNLKAALPYGDYPFSWQLTILDPCLSETISPQTQSPPADNAFNGLTVLNLSKFFQGDFDCTITYSCSEVEQFGKSQSSISCSDFTQVGVYTDPSSTSPSSSLSLNLDSAVYNTGVIKPGTYEVTISGGVPGGAIAQSAKVRFTLTDPCETADISAATQTTVTNTFDGESVLTLTPFTTGSYNCPISYGCDSLDSTKSERDDWLTCDSFTRHGIPYGELTGATGELKITLGASDHAADRVGDYVFLIKGVSDVNPTLTATAEVKLTVADPCPSATVTADLTTGSFGSVKFDDPQNLAITGFTPSFPACAATVACDDVYEESSKTTQATGLYCTQLTAGGSAGNYYLGWAATEDDYKVFIQPGTYFVDVKYTVGASSNSQSRVFRIEVIDLCTTVSITPTTQTQPQAGEVDAEQTFTLIPFTVDNDKCKLTYSCVEVQYGTTTDASLCSSFTTSGEAFGGSDTDLDQIKWTPSSADFGTGTGKKPFGPFRVIIKGASTADPTNFEEASFFFTVNDPCLSASISTTSQTNPSKNLYDGATVFTLTKFGTTSPIECSLVYRCTQIVDSSTLTEVPFLQCSDFTAAGKLFDPTFGTGDVGTLTITTSEDDKTKILQGSYLMTIEGQFADSASSNTAIITWEFSDPCAGVTGINAPSDTSVSINYQPDFIIAAVTNVGTFSLVGTDTASCSPTYTLTAGEISGLANPDSSLSYYDSYDGALGEVYYGTPLGGLFDLLGQTATQSATITATVNGITKSFTVNGSFTDDSMRRRNLDSKDFEVISEAEENVTNDSKSSTEDYSESGASGLILIGLAISLITALAAAYKCKQSTSSGKTAELELGAASPVEQEARSDI